MRKSGASVFGRACRVAALAALSLTTSPTVALFSPARAQTASLDLAQAGVQAFNIPAQPLADALIQFGRQAGLQISAETSLVRDLRTNGVAGMMNRDQALAMLLAGTGLTYRINGSMVALERPQTGTTSGAVQLEPLRIEGQRPPETAYGPIQGFVAHQSATATKTDTPLLETPQSISVVGREQILTQNSQTLVEALRYTPGVSANHNPVDSRFDSIRVRGFEPTLYLDSMQLPSGAAQFGRPKVDPFGLERVEVLRGPSSALYGQIPPGGMLNLISLRPTREALHMVEVQGNNFGLFQGGADLGGSLDEDGSFYYRLTGLAHAGGTQIDYVNDNRVMVAPAFTWQPSSDTKLTVLGQYQRDWSGVEIQFLPAQGTLLFNPNGTIPVGRFVGEPNDNNFDRTQYWAGYLFEHRFNPAIKVQQSLRYAAVDTNLAAVIGTGLQANLFTLNRATYNVPEAAQSFTLDNQLQASFDTGPLRHTGILGFDYRYAGSQMKQGVGAAPSLNIFAPVYGQQITPPTFSVISSQSQNQYGIYMQDQVALDRWRLTLSGREDWVDTSTNSYLANTQTYQAVSAFSGRAGLNYVFDFGLSPYVSYANSFQPTIGTTFGGTAFQPTTGYQYEAGVKYQPAGTNISTSLAAYQMVQQNALTPDPVHPGFNVQTGQITVKGIEFEFTASLARGMNIIGSYTYTDAKVTQSTSTDLGNQVITVPLHQGGLWSDFTIQEGRFRGLGFGSGIRYFGPTYGNNANTLLIPGYTLLDGLVHYDLGELNPRMKGAQLALNGSNLMNTAYVSTCANVTQCYYGAARTVTLTLRYNW
jgi:iron complex outermembrane receptor protein